MRSVRWVSTPVSRVSRWARSPWPVRVGVYISWPSAASSRRTGDHAQPPCIAPWTATIVAMAPKVPAPPSPRRRQEATCPTRPRSRRPSRRCAARLRDRCSRPATRATPTRSRSSTWRRRTRRRSRWAPRAPRTWPPRCVPRRPPGCRWRWSGPATATSPRSPRASCSSSAASTPSRWTRRRGPRSWGWGRRGTTSWPRARRTAWRGCAARRRPWPWAASCSAAGWGRSGAPSGSAPTTSARSTWSAPTGCCGRSRPTGTRISSGPCAAARAGSAS